MKTLVFNLNNMKAISCILIFCSSYTLSSQVFLQNMKKIDEMRYEDYSGNPFYFEENQNVNLYVIGDEKPFELENANLNLLTGSLEIYKGDQFAEIEKKKIDKIEAETSNVRLIISPEANSSNAFVVNLYQSEKYELIQNITAKTDQRTYNTPGKTMVKEYIRKNEEYSLFVNSEKYQIDIKKKEIVKVLGKDSEGILKKTKNKLKNEWDLVALLKALDSK